MSCWLRSVALLHCVLGGAANLVAQAGLEEKKGLVQGQVINALTGEPVRRAGVILNRVGERGGAITMGVGGPGGAVGATTDAGGRFSIPNVSPGTYMLMAEKTGFLRGSYGGRGAGRPGSMLKVSAGQEIQDVQFKLTPQAVIAGRVADEEGEPVQNVGVQVLTQRYFRGRRQLMPVSTGQTNDKGEYRLANLSPGKYMLSVSPNRANAFAARAADGSPDMSYATLYYPGVQDISQAAKVEVAAGVELGGMDFRLQKTRVYRIRGKVVDGNGVGMRNVFVSLNPRSTMGMFAFAGNGAAVRQGDGSFEIPNVAPGSYVLIARAMESGQQTSIQVPVEVGAADVEGIVLTPSKGFTVEGTVTADAQGVNVERTRVMLNPAEMGPASTHSAEARADGAFSITGVLQGKYHVMVISPAEDSYVSSIRMGGQEILGQELDLTAGVAERLQVTIKTGTGQVNATATGNDGAGAAATVVLIPQDARRNDSQSYRVGGADATGAISFRGLPPGDYKLFAWEDIEMGAWEDPEFMRRIEDQGVTVRVPARGTGTARVKIIPAK